MPEHTAHLTANQRFRERRRLGISLEPVWCQCGRMFAHQGHLTVHERSHAVDPVALFWSKVDRTAGPGACWPWLGPIQTAGYGHFALPKAVGGRATTAHRRALELTLGRSLGRYELACHRCDNPPCCNPSHLFAGSTMDNGRDASAKGRTAPQRHPERYRGEHHGHARLRDLEVVAIRERYASGAVTQAALGREFGVSQQTISGIVLGRSRVAA